MVKNTDGQNSTRAINRKCRVGLRERSQKSYDIKYRDHDGFHLEIMVEQKFEVRV